MHVTIAFSFLCTIMLLITAASKHMVAVMYYHSKSQTYEVDDEVDVLKYSDSMNIFCY